MGCACWANTYALGHEGHCCFLRDDRNRRINGGWRLDEEACHLPGTVVENVGGLGETPTSRPTRRADESPREG